MTYRDNDVYFSLGGSYSLISGSFTINSYSITSGQDPDSHIRSGMTVYCLANGRMRFSIGRKGSSTVGSWFNARINSTQNTFNHTAGDLNFAMMGTLKLTVTGGVLGGRQDTFTFSNIALAQGSTGTSNNWWFGGQSCSQSYPNQVLARGLDSRGAPVLIHFLRGDNDVSTVNVYPTSLVDTANWMSRLNNYLRLDQIMMPGSHDAGMSELYHSAPLDYSDPYTKTQSGSVAQQLVDGSRYFDIRVDYDHGALVTYHRTGANGSNGQDFKVVLDQVRSFLQAHPSETAIVKISHIRNYGDHNPADIKQRILNMMGEYAPMMYKNPSAGVNLAQINIGSVRGKMIVVFDYEEFIDPANGRFRYADYSMPIAGAHATVYDYYSNSDSLSTMKADQVQKWRAYGGQAKGYLFLLSWTLTPGPLSSSTETLAGVANRALPQALYEQIMTAYLPKPNIVYIDFLNDYVAQSIILYNFI